MKLLFSALFLALVLLPVSAQGQIGVYVNPIATRVSNSQPDTGPFAFLGAGNTSQVFWGANIGGYYDFAHGKSVDVGIDLRDSIQGWNTGRMNNFLIGARVVATSISPKWRPYVEVAGGVGTSRAPHQSIKTSRGRFGVFAGADYKLARHLDARVFEIGYGTLTTTSSSAVGNAPIGNPNPSYPSSGLLSFSAGLVFRFR
jgi:hypothetical protein